jgi:catechol 2,3-dioxygenase-like lactoylglutathione lyase family enzyme
MKIVDSNVTITVNNLDKSIAFYESIGFELKKKWDNYYAQLVAPGITIGLHPSEKNKSTPSGNISIGFTTDNIDETKAFLSKSSIDFKEREEEGGQFIHFTDADGTQLYFIKPKW